jgi:hypothetical protein
MIMILVHGVPTFFNCFSLGYPAGCKLKPF